MSVEIRKVDEPIYDGSSGEQVDTHTRYEIGGEINGTFVPFANVRQSYVKHLQRLDQEQKQNQEQTTSSGEGSQNSDETTS